MNKEKPFIKAVGLLFGVTAVALGIFGLTHLDISIANSVNQLTNASFGIYLRTVVGTVGYEAAKNILIARNIATIAGGLVGLGMMANGKPTS